MDEFHKIQPSRRNGRVERKKKKEEEEQVECEEKKEKKGAEGEARRRRICSSLSPFFLVLHFLCWPLERIN